ncbi:hypothetical protein ACIBF1_07245 [Spirillospora sp. NPDC050679]
MNSRRRTDFDAFSDSSLGPDARRAPGAVSEAQIRAAAERVVTAAPHLRIDEAVERELQTIYQGFQRHLRLVRLRRPERG